MKLTKTCCSIALTLFSMSLQLKAAQSEQMQELTAEAKQITKDFGGSLKPKLKKAIQTRGFVHAIDICALEAPKIAKALSEKTGWSIKRVSLKARNTDSATPDVFENEVLQQFDVRQKNGEAISTISYTKLTSNAFRFMKAQATEALCLNCHGQSIQPEIKKAILAHYPDDNATGYAAGEIRGAFSLTKKW